MEYNTKVDYTKGHALHMSIYEMQKLKVAY